MQQHEQSSQAGAEPSSIDNIDALLGAAEGALLLYSTIAVLDGFWIRAVA